MTRKEIYNKLMKRKMKNEQTQNVVTDNYTGYKGKINFVKDFIFCQQNKTKCHVILRN